MELALQITANSHPFPEDLHLYPSPCSPPTVLLLDTGRRREFTGIAVAVQWHFAMNVMKSKLWIVVGLQNQKATCFSLV